MALFEQQLPRRERYPARGWRWLTNWGMLIVDSIVLRVLFPAAAVVASTRTKKSGWMSKEIFEKSV